MSKQSELKEFIVTMRKPKPYFAITFKAKNKEEARKIAEETGNVIVNIEEV